MVLHSSAAWKLGIALALAAAIVISARAKAPSRPPPGGDLRRLVAGALALYGAGALAALTHHGFLAGAMYATGIVVCALACWLSRWTDSDGPSDPEEPVGEEPPPGPEWLPEFDWTAFERDFRAYSDRSREPAGVGR